MNSHKQFFDLMDLIAKCPPDAKEMIQGNPALLNLPGYLGESPLHYLAVENFSKEVRFLLELGASVDSTNEFGHTALMDCSRIGNLQMVDLLLNHGANPNLRSQKEGNTAMHWAALSGNISVVQRLEACGGNLDIKNLDAESARHLLRNKKDSLQE